METRGTCRAKQTPGPALHRECGRGAAQARLRHRRTRGVKDIGSQVKREAGDSRSVSRCVFRGAPSGGLC